VPGTDADTFYRVAEKTHAHSLGVRSYLRVKAK
jgi:hypothetical protein